MLIFIEKMDHAKEIEKYKTIFYDLKSNLEKSQEEISKNKIHDETIVSIKKMKLK